MKEEISKIIQISDYLDRIGKSAEADAIDEFISKHAKKGYHSSGLKEESVKLHLELFKDYQEASAQLKSSYNKALKEKDPTALQGKLRDISRDLAYNSNSVFLHQMYVEDILESKPYELEQTNTLWQELKSRYENRIQLLDDIRKLAKVPRSGWVVVSFCTIDGDISLNVIDLHETGIITHDVPILAFDMWEHAYLNDFGNDKDAYIDWMFSRIDWRNVERRLKRLMKLKTGD